MQDVMPQDISDEFWSKVKPLIPTRSRSVGRPYRRAPGAGRKAADPRRVLAQILYVLRHRITWSAAIQTVANGPTLHRYFYSWQKAGLFNKLQQSELIESPEMRGIPWHKITAATRSKARAEPVRAQVQGTKDSIWEPTIQSRLLKLHASANTSAFWSSTQTLLGEAIPHNSNIAYLDYFDHPKSWKAARVLASPNAQMPATWFDDRWKIDITPPYICQHRGVKVFKLSEIIPDSRRFFRSEYFTRFFKPFGWYHTACLAFWNDNQISSVIALRRTQAQGNFSAGEVDFLNRIHPHLDTVLRRLRESHREQAKMHCLTDMANVAPQAIMFLDWNLDPLYVNQEGWTQCAVWNFGPQKARAYNAREVYRLPVDICRVCESLKTQWLQLNGSLQKLREAPFPETKLINGAVLRRRATIALIPPGRNAVAKPGFRVLFETREEISGSTGTPFADGLFCRLTSAERELARLAMMGASNLQIAAQLHKSVNTIKHQLTSIYNKLGLQNRRQTYLGHILAIKPGPMTPSA